MGDRALIVFRDSDGYSPTVYLHWKGGEVGKLLTSAAPRMRGGDASYACARFAGVCHENIPGGCSLGLLNTPEDGRPSSHGDAGVFVVNVTSGEVEVYGGYGFDYDRPELPLKFGQ